MTGMNLLDAMEQVDPELIEAAENPPVKKKKTVPFVWTGAAAAACVAVIAGVSFVVVQSRSTGSAAASAEMAAEAPAYEEIPEAAMDAAAEDNADALYSAEPAEESAKTQDSAMTAEGREADNAMPQTAEESAAEIHTPAQVIAQLNEELQKLAADETGFQGIEFVMTEGKPTINVTITEEQAELYDTDQTASDAFDGVLTDLAGQIGRRLHEYSFMGGVAGYVYIDGQTEPYRFFDEEHVWDTQE